MISGKSNKKTNKAITKTRKLKNTKILKTLAACEALPHGRTCEKSPTVRISVYFVFAVHGLFRGFVL
jgi:hypothetical protein